jgi:hypothetical protein
VSAGAPTPPIPCFCCRSCDRSRPTVAFDAAGGDNVSMSRDDTSDFRPRPGRIRDHGARKARQPKSFFAQVMKAAAKANGGPLTSAQLSGGSQHSPRSTGLRKGRCSRIGRGQAAADRLKLAAGQRDHGQRSRRVAVKARIVRLKAGS